MARGLRIEILDAYEQTPIVARELMRFSSRLLVPLEALELAGTMLREAVEKQFDTEGGYASGGWPELAASTVAHKAREDLHSEILRATDALKDALTRKFDSRHVERVSAASLTFGATVPYGVFHQSTRPRTKIPYRPPIALTETDKRAMAKGMQAAILHSVRGGYTGALGGLV
jgi:phage gpG-like protein